MIKHSQQSKGFMPTKSGPNLSGFYMGNSSNLMQMYQTGGQTSRGAAILARSRQRRADIGKLEDQQRAEGKRQKRGGLFGSLGGLGGGLLAAALAPVTGGASLALAAGLGTALGRGIGERLGAGKAVDYDSSGTVYGQQSFRDMDEASEDFNKGILGRAGVAGLKAAATAGLAPGGGIYGKVGGKLATSQARQALKEAIPMAIKQAPSSLMSKFRGAPTSGLPVSPSVDLDAVSMPFNPSASAKIFDPSSVFPASTYNPMASNADALLGASEAISGSGISFSDAFRQARKRGLDEFMFGGNQFSTELAMEDGGFIGYENGGSVNIQQILQDAGVTATPNQLAMFEQYDPTQLSRATEAISGSLMGMTGGEGLASSGSGFGAQTSAIGEAVEKSQKSLDQQREDEQKAFESQTLQQLAIEEDKGAEFGKYIAPNVERERAGAGLVTRDEGVSFQPPTGFGYEGERRLGFDNVMYTWSSATNQWIPNQAGGADLATMGAYGTGG